MAFDVPWPLSAASEAWRRGLLPTATWVTSERRREGRQSVELEEVTSAVAEKVAMRTGAEAAEEFKKLGFEVH